MDSCHEESRQSQGRRGSNQVLARWTKLGGEVSYVYYVLTLYILHSGTLKKHYSDSHGSGSSLPFHVLMWKGKRKPAYRRQKVTSDGTHEDPQGESSGVLHTDLAAKSRLHFVVCSEKGGELAA